jgi:hypothetical protein
METNRRDILKSLIAVPTFGSIINGAKATYGVTVDTTKQIIVWVDKDVMSLEQAKKELPANAIVIPVTVPHGMTIDQVIRVTQPEQ